MIGEKGFPLRLRRKSFDVEGLRESAEQKSTAFGKDLGFWSTCFLGFQTLGSIYGDIGTSPLYVYTGVFQNSTAPPREDVVGAVSCIIWSLTLIPLIKYCLLVLRAGDDQGEGGTFVLYMVLSRYLHLDNHTPTISNDDSLTLTATETRDSTTDQTGPPVKGQWIKNNKVARIALLLWCLFGASCVMADGLLTPAVSVISAVTGIAVPAPSLNSSIVPISIAIIVFLVQRFGTKYISLIFAPIVGLWFAALFFTGLVNIFTNDPGIFKAYNPAYAINYLVRTKDLTALGGVFLAVTGSEALFADLGHYNRQSIQWTFTLVVYPSLVIAYLGQAAALEVHPEWISNTFYNSIPCGPGSALYWVVFVLATLATVIASQAMILGAFSIIHQAMQLDCFPSLTVIHTDPKVPGRVYISLVNWILMIIIILVCVGFGTSYHLTNAYGLTVASVMIVTTILLSMVWYIVWGFVFIVPLAFLVFYGLVDGVFWAATLNKLLEGAWFPLMVGIVMTCFMSFWRWGMTKKRAYELDRRVRLSELLRLGEDSDLKGQEAAFILGDGNRFKDEKLEPSELETSPTFSTSALGPPRSVKSSASTDSIAIISSQSSDPQASELRRRKLFLRTTNTPVARIPGISIYYTAAATSSSHAPCTFRHFLEHFPVLHSTCIFLHVRTAAQPHVPPHERLAMTSLPMWDGIWRGVYRIGYMETPDFTSPDFTLAIFEHLGRPVEPLTHILQRTTLKGKKPKDTKGIWGWIKSVPVKIRGWAIGVVWTGIDEAIGGVAKGWIVAVEDVVSVGAVAKV